MQRSFITAILAVHESQKCLQVLRQGNSQKVTIYTYVNM